MGIAFVFKWKTLLRSQSYSVKQVIVSEVTPLNSCYFIQFDAQRKKSCSARHHKSSEGRVQSTGESFSRA